MNKTNFEKVVTGATDGIGKAYAQELARRGINIVLISRSPEKLERVAKEIEAEYHVQTKCIAVDFATLGMGIYEKIKNELGGDNVRMNNVGVLQAPEAIHNAKDPKSLMDVVTVNSQPVVQMTLMVLPQMIARKKGAILNVSSISALVPIPLLAVYSASKAFVDHFTDAVQFETRGSGVIIQLVRPLGVATKLIQLSPNVLIPTATYYVRSAIATIGLQDNTVGCMSHELQSNLLKMPKTWVKYFWETIVRRVVAEHEAAGLIETKND